MARRIASNVAIAYLKRPLTRPFTPFRATLSPLAGRGDLAVQMDAREKIARAFQSLPPKLRAAAALALIEEESYDEIAAGLGISVAAVKSRVFRATHMLRKKLERMGIDR